MGRDLKWIGLIGTVLYFLVFWFYLPAGLDDFKQLKPNELGDTLAGAFSPLALFWLILGFFQQGRELRQNNEALKLQAAELKSAVDQHREMVRISENQLNVDIDNSRQSRAELEMKRTPRIYPWCSEVRPLLGEVEVAMYITNLGGTADRIFIEVPEAGVNLELLNVTGPHGHHFTFRFNSGGVFFTLIMNVEYVTGKFLKMYHMHVDYDAGALPKIRLEEV